MSDNNKFTVFQKLNNVLLGSRKPQSTSQQFNLNKGELLRTTSHEEINTKKLQSQQDKFLRQQWHKVEGETLRQAMHYEVTRLGSYSDFENMEFFPEIAAALDIFMDESCSLNRKGEIMNIHSSSTRIKTELEKLFYGNLKLHTNLPMWIRNTIKYGDNFLFLNIRESLGVVTAKQLPNFEMHREEMDFLESIREYEKPSETTFEWRGKNLKFKNWQVAHFRLLGDDRKLPYGTSHLEKCRRIWKQLVLAEDSMLVYRVTRAPERRVYKIYVGNLDEDDIPGYVNDIANRFKRAPLIDPQTGQIDLRYNQAANDQDFFIPVRDENMPMPIETLPGAQNLGDIEDIEYLQKKLCIALRVPRTFLGFEDSVGEGKNLALMDIRFARSINRIQQSIIQELNKIAIIHLHMLGFDDDLSNFTLSLNNPSTQAKMLEIEQEQIKTTLFKDLVSDAGDGFKVMSRTRALKEVFNWSDDEILQDLLEQRMEKAAAAEMENTANVIKHTGLFDKVDKMYGDIEAAKKGGGAPPEESGDGGGGGANFGGGGADFDFGDEGDLGDEGAEAPEGGAEGTETPEEEVPQEDLEGLESDELQESLKRKITILESQKKKLIEQTKIVHEKRKMDYFDKLTKSYKKPKTILEENTNFIKETDYKVTKTISDLIDKIDKKLM